jgi:hypothetical protein
MCQDDVHKVPLGEAAQRRRVDGKILQKADLRYLIILLRRSILEN